MISRQTSFGTALLLIHLLTVSPAQEMSTDFRSTPVSAADCSFQQKPDDFLSAQGRIRREVFERAGKFNRNAAAGEPATVPAREIPRRNFIDDEIFGRLESQNVPSAPLSSDEEFFRRISFDLVGRLPSSAEVREFVADRSPGKRDEAIDRLLYSPEFVDKWTLWFGDLLQITETLSTAAINRRVTGRNAYYTWVRQAVADNKSVRDMVWQVVAQSGSNYANDTGSVNFMVGASASMGPAQDTYDMMMYKTVSTFLGLGHYDCLACHNGRGHLDQISLWGKDQIRMDAWQMAAFFSRARLQRNNSGREKQYVDSMYDSTDVADVLTGQYDLNTTSGNRPARCANNLAPDPKTNRCFATASIQPEFRETHAKPRSTVWRASFADFVLADPMFGRNFANRFWKQMFNLALVDPVDTMDPARLDPRNPPPSPWTLQAAQPELLEKLAQAFMNNGTNFRQFLKLLVESSAYQLSSRYDGTWKVEYVPLFARHYARRLDGEEVHDAIAKATGNLASYRYPLSFAQAIPEGSAVPQSDPVSWAMQLPDPNVNVGGSAFMNYFFRGNRDSQARSQAGSILQQLALMNDTFVTTRIKMANSPVLREVAKQSGNDAALDELYLSFLSRLPTAEERDKGRTFLGRAANATARNAALEDMAWALINRVEFLFSY